MRRFAGLRLAGPLPDETTILHFRHLQERHGFGTALFEGDQRRRLMTGMFVDASIIEAPSSTKNRTGERNPEMHQAKKGDRWHFGMKAHIGVDAESGLAHSLETTASRGCGAIRAIWGSASAKSTRGRAVAWR